MAYRFIQEHKQEFWLRWLLARLQILPNAYYNYLKDTTAKSRLVKRGICKEIKDIYHGLNGIIGYRNMQVFLARKGITLSKATVHKYMNKELHLRCICRRKKPGYRKGYAHKVFPNLLNQQFATDRPNAVWCTDFTYMHLSNGTVRYNCAIIDLYDRSVVASENDAWITSNLAIRTLEKALQASSADPRKLVLHSDQGSQFTSLEYTRFCYDRGITQSMSKTGCPYDNAPMERYYNTLKSELAEHLQIRYCIATGFRCC